ncbi:MAG: extracellular solute-binding protein [Treponema sp.]|jgi:ABC-type glycerol-3-phosphate transport system substrate-binding protein|nr:extracellular solute-binding protein [Treponema sp.]
MKKTVMFISAALILSLLTTGSLFAGGNSQKSSGVTTIRVWTNDAHNKLECDQLVEKFNKGIGAQKGIKVEYTVYGSDWDTAMNMALSTGREPDLFKGCSNLINYQTEGKLLPWKEIPGVDDILKAQEQYHINQDTVYNGDIYSVALYGWSTGFHYNKSLLQRAGYSAPPKTWAEFEDAAIKISKLEPGKIYGYAVPLVWYPDFRHWIIEIAAASSIGHTYYNPAQGKYMMADYAPYYEVISRIRDAGAVFPGMENLSDDQMRAQFAAGNIGFIHGGGWNVGVLYDQFPFQGDPLGWDYATLPVQDPQKIFATPMFSGGSLYASAQLKKDANKLSKVNEVIRLFCGDEMQSLLMTNGKNLPLRPDITAKAAPSERPQWSSYGRAAASTITLPAMPHDLLAPEGADMSAVMSQILTGQIKTADIRNALIDLDRRYNAALQQAVDRGIIKIADYTDPAMDDRFKAK